LQKIGEQIAECVGNLEKLDQLHQEFSQLLPEIEMYNFIMEIEESKRNEYIYGEVFLNNTWIPCRFRSLEPFQGQYSVVVISSTFAVKHRIVGMNLVLPGEKIRIRSKLHYDFECAAHCQNQDWYNISNIIRKILNLPTSEIQNSKNNQGKLF